MTPDTSTLAGKIAVMQAALEGKPIQRADKGSNAWCGVDERHSRVWCPNWMAFDYRIEPTEPLRCSVHIGGHDEAIPMIQLTPEVESALKAAGIITGANA